MFIKRDPNKPLKHGWSYAFFPDFFEHEIYKDTITYNAVGIIYIIQQNGHTLCHFGTQTGSFQYDPAKPLLTYEEFLASGAGRLGAYNSYFSTSQMTNPVGQVFHAPGYNTKASARFVKETKFTDADLDAIQTAGLTSLPLGADGWYRESFARKR